MMAFLDFSLAAVENEGVLCAAVMISAGAEREGGEEGRGEVKQSISPSVL